MKAAIMVLPIEPPPDPRGILHRKVATAMAQFAHDTGRKRTYDILAGGTAVDVLRMFQEFLDAVQEGS